MTGRIDAGAVRQRLEALAPPILAESWDNVGWQVGDDAAEITGILVTLDVDQAVVDEAARRRANLIVAHHPLIFGGLKRINPRDPMGRLLRRLLCDEIHVYAAHTNLDAVRGGVNDALAEALGLEPVGPLDPTSPSAGGWGFGAICESDGVSTAQMVRRVIERLGTPSPRLTPGMDAPSLHTRIALLGGSGGSLIERAMREHCTLFITGEVKYHDAQAAARAGMTIVEADHFYSERPVLRRLVKWLEPLGVPVWEAEQVTSPFAPLAPECEDD
jgi:dinuclear metal center YbgI/SA1388 family protein